MRTFVAILAPQEIREKINSATIPLQEKMGVRLLPPESWHITLAFLGEMPDKEVREVSEALSRVRFPPFKVSLSGAGAYPNERFPRAIFIGGKSEGAEKLAEEIRSVLGLSDEGKGFSLHLTVARSKGAGDIEEFLQKTKEVCDFEVKSFCLMKSNLLPRGAAYEIIREYKCVSKQGSGADGA